MELLPRHIFEDITDVFLSSPSHIVPTDSDLEHVRWSTDFQVRLQVRSLVIELCTLVNYHSSTQWRSVMRVSVASCSYIN